MHRIAKAVLSNLISHAQASAATRAIEGWMKAHAAGEVTAELADATALLQDLRATLRGDPSARDALMQVVK